MPPRLTGPSASPARLTLHNQHQLDALPDRLEFLTTHIVAQPLLLSSTTPDAWWDDVESWRLQEKPPAFGHPMLAEFDLDAKYTNLNQGSYGSTPRRVRQATEALVRAAEANPDLWFRGGLASDGANALYIDQLIASRKALADYIKAPANETSIVDNASHGINAVLRSVPDFLTKKGILYLDLAYGEVKAALSYMGGSYPGADSDPSIDSPGHRHPLHQVNTSSLGTDLGAARLVPLVEAALAAAQGGVGLCSFSHIVSIPALVLPVKELAAACRRAGALTLIDGAHVPGNLELDVPSLGADFYVGNGHKHLYTSRGVCLLWARADAQKYLYPLVIDGSPPNTGTPFEQAFMYQGTSDDLTRYISLRAALAWRAWLGEAAVVQYTHGLATQACAHLSQQWGTRALSPDVQANMCNVELPCKADCPAQLGYTLYRKYDYYIPVFEWAGSTWMRITCTVYNEMSDIELVARTVPEALAAAPRAAAVEELPTQRRID